MNDPLNSSDEGGLNTYLKFDDQYERMITRQLGSFISDYVKLQQIHPIRHDPQ
jgi:hypothetical protein